MVLTVFCALSSYVLLGTALSEMADSVTQALRPGWPFDVTVEGRIDLDQVDLVKSMDGVRLVETAKSTTVYLGPSLQEVISVSTSSTSFVLELAEGRLPNEFDEIAIPELLADALRLTVGDSLKLLPPYPGAMAHEYLVVGVLSGKTGVLTLPLLSEDGISLVRGGESNVNRLLIQLDGSKNLETFSKSLGQVVGDLTIRLDTDGYDSIQESRSLSESLVIILRFLILLITAASLSVLFYLSQRSGAYQTGVLRAIGVQQVWLLVPSLGMTVLVFVLGFPVTALLLPVVAAKIGLHADRAFLISALAKDLGMYILVGLLSTLLTNWQFLSMPVPRLLKDSW